MLATIPATECQCKQRSLMWPRDTACLSSHAAQTQLAQELGAGHSGSQRPSAERPGSVRVENAAPPCLPARCRDCTKLIFCPHEILLRLFSAVAACRQGLRAVRSSVPSPCTLVPEPAHPTSEGARPVREGQNSWTARCWPSSPDVVQDSGETAAAEVAKANLRQRYNYARLISRPGDTFGMSRHSTRPIVTTWAKRSQIGGWRVMQVTCRTAH